MNGLLLERRRETPSNMNMKIQLKKIVRAEKIKKLQWWNQPNEQRTT